MFNFVNDSIKHLEDLNIKSDYSFDMNRLGYIFLTKKKENNYINDGKYKEKKIGIGKLRIHKNISTYIKSNSSSIINNELDVKNKYIYFILFYFILF